MLDNGVFLGWLLEEDSELEVVMRETGEFPYRDLLNARYRGTINVIDE